MRVVITCKGQTLQDLIDRRLGRSLTFLLVDPDTLDVEAIPNQASSEPVGASIGAARQLTYYRDMEAVITGRIGPSTTRILETAGIPVCAGVEGTALQALKDYRSQRVVRTPPTRKRLNLGSKIGRTLSESHRNAPPPTSGFHGGAEPTLPGEERDEN